MVIVKIHGGLGNQMFQYAMGRRTALANNVELKLDLNWFDDFGASTPRTFVLNKFNIQGTVASNDEILRFLQWETRLGKRLCGMIPVGWRRYIREPFRKPFDPRLLSVCSDVYLDGYWADEKYFADMSDVIRNDFVLIDYDMRDKKLENRLGTTNSVSIHVRRGDYTSLNDVVNLNSIYYNDAIDTVNAKNSNCEYYVFSDDIEWVKLNINFKCKVDYVTHPKDSNPNYEMLLMSMCKHNITANSTFSWWGAWLNNNPEKIVVTPEKWFKTKTYGTYCNTPKDWIRLKPHQ